MSELNDDENPKPETKELTTAQAAKLVNIKTSELLSFKDYGTRVVVVTLAGKKLTVDKNVKA